MTKLARQQTIVELAQDAPLPSQHKLCKVLGKRGFPVTQATLSRDLNELRLVKTSEGYVLPNSESPAEALPPISRVVGEYVREVRRAQNLLVIKTTVGSAQPVAAALDDEQWPEAVGSVAGDDTILIVCPDKKAATRLEARTQEMLA
jgi:transcriptional regulator of arginine metabolism